MSVVCLFQYGLVGHFWFAASMTIQLFLFSIVAAEIRIKAPGAKTYLQVCVDILSLPQVGFHLQMYLSSI